MLVVAEREKLPVPQAKAGEPEAWDILFRRYQLPLYVYVFELVHDEQTSLDLVQETFIAAVRHIGSLRDDAKFGSWLFGIAHQKCIQRWRKQGREKVLLDEIPESAEGFEGSPDDLLIRREQEAEFMNSASCSRRMSRSSGLPSNPSADSGISSSKTFSRPCFRQRWMHFWCAMPKSQLPNFASSRRLPMCRTAAMNVSCTRSRLVCSSCTSSKT